MGEKSMNAINLFNPDLVIIGAGVSKAGRLLVGPVKRVVKARALQMASEKVDVKISTLGEDAGALGAAILVLKNIFARRVSCVARKSIPILK